VYLFQTQATEWEYNANDGKTAILGSDCIAPEKEKERKREI